MAKVYISNNLGKINTIAGFKGGRIKRNYLEEIRREKRKNDLERLATKQNSHIPQKMGSRSHSRV